MKRQIAVVLVLACVLGAASGAPAAAALEFYVRIQGPKPAKPPLAHTNPSLSFDSNVPATIGATTGGAGSGKIKFGDITITKVPQSNAMAPALSSPASNAGSGPLVRQIVTVGCAGFNVQADFGKGPVRGALASQSEDGICIFTIPMSAPAAQAIVRVGLPDTPPGWSFNSQPLSKCVRSGETLDGTLSEAQDIFSYMWSAPHPVAGLAAPAPCTKT